MMENKDAIRRVCHHPLNYEKDVERFNLDHNYNRGCQLARTAGSDYTECDTHNAYVKHGVPEVLR